jgi:hypothetical protein
MKGCLLILSLFAGSESRSTSYRLARFSFLSTQDLISVAALCPVTHPDLITSCLTLTGLPRLWGVDPATVHTPASAVRLSPVDLNAFPIR